MWQKIQMYIFVTLITILVWLYAEGENLKLEEFSPEIQFVAAQGRRLLIQPSRPPRRVDVTLRGPNGKLQEILRLQPFKIELLDNPDSPDPEQKIDLEKRIQTLPVVQNLGLNVLKVEPPTVTVRVERMETRTLPIDVVAGGDLQFQSKPIINPVEATVELPAGRAALLGPNPRVIARLQLVDPKVNQQIVVDNVPLSLPEGVGDDDITITPETVSVTVTITQKTKQSQALSVPIYLVAPISELAKYEVRLENSNEQLLHNMIFEGPNAVIDQIDAKQLTIHAELHLSGGDLENAALKPNDPSATPVVLVTPPGVIAVAPPPPIKYRVIRRQDTAAATTLERPVTTP